MTTKCEVDMNGIICANDELRKALQGMIEAQGRDEKYNRIATDYAKKVLNG